jgi:hypothetical protein
MSAGTSKPAPSARGSWGTDGSRFTYTYELDGDVLCRGKNSPTFSRGSISGDGRHIDGRWTIPGARRGLSLAPNAHRLIAGAPTCAGRDVCGHLLRATFEIDS